MTVSRAWAGVRPFVLLDDLRTGCEGFEKLLTGVWKGIQYFPVGMKTERATA